MARKDNLLNSLKKGASNKDPEALEKTVNVLNQTDESLSPAETRPAKSQKKADSSRLNALYGNCEMDALEKSNVWVMIKTSPVQQSNRKPSTPFSLRLPETLLKEVDKKMFTRSRNDSLVLLISLGLERLNDLLDEKGGVPLTEDDLEHLFIDTSGDD